MYSRLASHTSADRGRRRSDADLPLHRLVWDNRTAELKRVLATEKHDLEQKDTFGRTPLRLAVALDHSECASLLLEAGSDATSLDASGWSAVHDATAAGNEQLLANILRNRQYRLETVAENSVPQLLTVLEDAPNFSVDLEWSFSSWIPFVSQMCPNDTIRIHKRGKQVRMDMTLLDFNNMTWERGNRTILFKAIPKSDDGRHTVVEIVNIDHDNQLAFVERIEDMGQHGASQDLDSFSFQTELASRLNSPVTTTVMDHDKVAFHRLKSGVWGFQRDRTDTIGDYQCKVFSTSGMELVTKTRVEHLPKSHPARKKKASVMGRLLGVDADDETQPEAEGSQGSLLSWFTRRSTTNNDTNGDEDDGVNDEDTDDDDDEEEEQEEEATTRGEGQFGVDDDREADVGMGHAKRRVGRLRYLTSMTFEDYLSGNLKKCRLSNLQKKRATKLSRSARGQTVDALALNHLQRMQKQRFKPTLWLCDDFPLSLQDQVLPIFELLAPTNNHIAKLRDFISLRLPAGFPVQIELPVYRVVTGRATFANFSPDEPSEELFEIPAGYRILSQGDIARGGDDAALAFSLQQALRQHDNAYDESVYDADLQRAIAASLNMSDLPSGVSEQELMDPDLVAALRASMTETPDQPQQPQQSQRQQFGPTASMSEDEQLRLALEQSLLDTQKDPEEEELARVLALSLQEK
eukprot:m.21827 g.21827  ORF g.21827 m.21827 type:complete len:692 (-) comp9187_c0_seq3:1651-3726(-)